MKVTYLKLKNFNAIYSTLNLKTIEIDFTKMKNDILLFIGTNGSCKTYIQSNIHPFAHVGNVDVRSGQDMIIPEKDGEKVIKFLKDNGDEYTITHHYQYQKRGRKIHSYIEKNGVEMNPSGLVTTFNQLVEIEFGIDIGFLRVIRLGSNVNNLVALKSSDRKEFAVKLLNEVDEYIVDSKRADERSRNEKAALKNVAMKIKRLNIEDEIIYKNEIQDLETRLSDLTKRRESITADYFTYKGKVNASLESAGGIETVQRRCDELEKAIIEAKHQVDEAAKEAKQLYGKRVFVHDIPKDEMLEQYKLYRAELEKNKAANDVFVTMLSGQQMQLQSEVMDLENKIKSFSISTDIENIENDLAFAKKFDDTYKKYYEGFAPKCTKQDLMDDLAIMQNIADMILSTREFSDGARKMYLDHQNNISHYIGNRLIKLSSELSLCDNETEHDIKAMEAPEECAIKEKCAFYKMYHQERKKGTRNVKDIEDDIEVTKECSKVDDCIRNIEVILGTRKGRDRLPYKVNIEDIKLDIMNGTVTFFDFEEGTHRITFLEKYDEWKSNREAMERYEKDIEYQRKQQEALDSGIVKQHTEKIIALSDVEKRLKKYRKNRQKLNDDIELCDSIIEDIKKYIDVIDRENEAHKLMDANMAEYNGLSEQVKELKNFEEHRKLYEEQMETLKENIAFMTQTIYDKRATLKEYETLRQEQKDLEKNFEDTELIKNAVSAKRGIPLLYLKLHFGNARNIANRIISAVYGDAIQLERFIIDDKEFRIPYTKNGTVVDDVQYASQGEISIISLALSFALIEEFSGRAGYNILLLDEVDGPLDKSNKEKFLRVLEAQMERIGCNQLFMITHNQLFENYPVDVFITIDKNDEIDQYKNVNIIN